MIEEQDDTFSNPLRQSNDEGAMDTFETEISADPKHAKRSSSSPKLANAKTMDDWGNLSISGILYGEVDQFILNWCRNACSSMWLDAFILLAIIFNTFLLAAAGPANTHSKEILTMMMVADIVLTIVFTLEMLIRIIALGFYDKTGNDPIPKYMNDSWNKMDFFVVISSWLNIIVEFTGIELGVSMASLRALRILRVLKAFKSIDGIRIILATISAAIPHTIDVVFFMGFLFIVSGIIGVQMFRGRTTNRCEYSSFELLAQVDEDRYPLVEGQFLWNSTDASIPIDAATSNEYAPGPFPHDSDPTYEYPIGIGMWATYCTVDEDCPLHRTKDPWNRTQVCRPAINPGKSFSSYDSAPEAWMTLFINMACLYWWETAHRYLDANSMHEVICTGTADDPIKYPSCEEAFASSTLQLVTDCPGGCKYVEGGPGSIIAWGFGAFNVGMLTLVSVNMFVAAVTTIFMDQRSTENPDGGAVARKDRTKKLQAAAAWSKPPYFVSLFGGEGPFVEPLRGKLSEIKEALQEAEAEEEKWPGSRKSDIPRILQMISDREQDILNANGSEKPQPEIKSGIIHQAYFDQFILGFITLNTVALAAEHHDREQCVPMQIDNFESYNCVGCQPSLQVTELCQSPQFLSYMAIANYIFNLVFSLECIMKILGMGFKQYIRLAFNQLDFFIVVTSTFDMIGEAFAAPGESGGPSIFKLFRVFRLFRVLRVARILYRNENLKRVLITVFGSGEALANLTLFIIFSVLLFSILGMHLLSGHYIPPNITPSSPYGINNGTLLGRMLGDGVYDIRKEGAEVRYGYDVQDFITKGLIPRRNFEDFPRAFLLSFQVMTGDDWVNQMHDYLEVRPGWVTWLIFFSNFGICNFILLSLFIAVILENFAVAEAQKMELQQNLRETKQRKAEETAKKPKIYFPHRLVWLFGGVKAGKKPGTVWSMGKDVKVYISDPFDLEDPRNGMLIADERWYNDDKALFFFELDNGVRRSLRALAENPVFDTAILGAIILGTVLLALEGPPGSLPAETVYLFDKINDVLFLIFVIEFVAKLIGYGFLFTPESYLKNTWNRLDFVVIIGSVVNYLGGNAGFVRLLRCLRPLRIINRNEGMKVIISAVVDSLAVNIGVLALSGLGLLIFGILGVSLFAGVMWSCNCAYVYPIGVTPQTAVFGSDGGWLNISTNQYVRKLPTAVLLEDHCVGSDRSGGIYGIDPTTPNSVSQCYWDNRPYNFDEVGNAMMSLFTASTLAGWTDIMEAGIDQAGIGYQPQPFNHWMMAIYFMIYVMVMAFFVTNLFVGVLIDFISTNDGSALLTEAQQEMTDTMKYAKLHRPELVRQAPYNPIRKWCWGLVESFCWQLTSNGFIIFNVIVMMCEYHGQSGQWWLTLELANRICLIFFTVEMFIKLIGYYPREYISDPWHKFDAVVITLSWAGILFNLGGAQAIRAMRALRIVVVLKSAKGIRSLFQTLLLSLAPAFNISVLLLLLYSVYAILGMMLFGNTPVQDIECMIENTPDKIGRYGFADPVADYCKIGMGIESCTPSINPFSGEVVNPEVNCTDGYVPGTAKVKSDTCKQDCTLVEATYRDRSSWFSSFAKGRPGQMLVGSNRQYTKHANFHDFLSSLKLLFQCATGQDWKFVMYAVGGEPGQPGATSSIAFLFFGSFFFLSNYILLNLFVAVILDNFSASMRESELRVSEEDVVAFKFKFRQKTTDKQPEMLLFTDLWALLRDVGGSEQPNEDGDVSSPSKGGPSALSPSFETWWNNDLEMAWALSCEPGLAPSDLKGFMKELYSVANSPLKQDGQPGISFREYFDVFLRTSATFDSADQSDVGLLEDWEVARLAYEQDVFSEGKSPKPPPYAVIKAAVKCLRFNLHYSNLCKELEFHNAGYNGRGTELKYDQVLQALVNVEMGAQALSLEDQIHRGVAAKTGFRSNRAQAEAELAELEQTEFEWKRKVDYARMNPSKTSADVAALEKQLERVTWAKMEHEEWLEKLNEEEAREAEKLDDPTSPRDATPSIVDGEAVEHLPESVGMQKVQEAQAEAHEAKALADKLASQLAAMTETAETAAADLVTQRHSMQKEIDALKNERESLRLAGKANENTT
eukprot:SAG31_NODE_570_length_14016_cov_10.573543_4_plen_2093_part_00